MQHVTPLLLCLIYGLVANRAGVDLGAKDALK
jgi:hypothetical protein